MNTVLFLSLLIVAAFGLASLLSLGNFVITKIPKPIDDEVELERQRRADLDAALNTVLPRFTPMASVGQRPEFRTEHRAFVSTSSPALRGHREAHGAGGSETAAGARLASRLKGL